MCRFRATWVSNVGMANTSQLRPENEVGNNGEKGRLGLVSGLFCALKLTEIPLNTAIYPVHLSCYGF